MTLIDSLDTLAIIGNDTEFIRAVDMVLKNVKVDINVNVSVFEINIRVVGGLLSAHMLSGRIKSCFYFLNLIRLLFLFFKIFHYIRVGHVLEAC